MDNVVSYISFNDPLIDIAVLTLHDIAISLTLKR